MKRLPILIVAILMFFTLIPAAPARAAGLWFVAGFTGSDANSCMSPIAPCRTINAAIAKALAGDTIDISAEPYTNSGATEVVRVTKNLTLNGGWDAVYNQQIGYTILNGEHQRRGLTVLPGVTVQVSHIAIVWGFALDGAGAYIQGTFYGDHMIVAQNRSFRGAGFFFDNAAGRMDISTSAIYANEYYDRGGGIFVNDGKSYTSTVTVSSNVSINSVDEEHGTPPTFAGGVYLYHGYFWASNATFAENTRFDGHLFTQGGADLANGFNYGAIQIANVLISDGCTGYIDSAGNNLERAATCQLGAAGDVSGINPQIFPADVNGGSTITHALAATSPAIDIASIYYCGNPSYDQRGEPRPQGAGCDIGAVERKADDPQGDGIGGDPCPLDPAGLPPAGTCGPDPATLLRTLLVPGPLQVEKQTLARYAASREIPQTLKLVLVRNLDRAGKSLAGGDTASAVKQLTALVRQMQAQHGSRVGRLAARNILAQTQALLEFLTLAPLPISQCPGCDPLP